MNTASGDPAWAEINGFSFYVPHHNLHIGIYLLLRPALGVASASVFMNSRDAMLPWRADYSDMRSHLPLPEAAVSQLMPLLPEKWVVAVAETVPELVSAYTRTALSNVTEV